MDCDKIVAVVMFGMTVCKSIHCFCTNRKMLNGNSKDATTMLSEKSDLWFSKLNGCAPITAVFLLPQCLIAFAIHNIYSLFGFKFYLS